MESAAFQKALGAAIRTRREELQLSQEDFADHVGLHRTYVGSVERGERNLGVENLHKIASGLGLDTSVLVASAEVIGRSRLKDKR